MHKSETTPGAAFCTLCTMAKWRKRSQRARRFWAPCTWTHCTITGHGNNRNLYKLHNGKMYKKKGQVLPCPLCIMPKAQAAECLGSCPACTGPLPWWSQNTCYRAHTNRTPCVTKTRSNRDAPWTSSTDTVQYRHPLCAGYWLRHMRNGYNSLFPARRSCASP